jgi:hypothetical protein
VTSDKGRRELDYSAEQKQELGEKIHAALPPEDSRRTLSANNIEVRNIPQGAAAPARWLAVIESDDDPDDPVVTRPPDPLPFEPDGRDGFDPLFPPGV